MELEAVDLLDVGLHEVEEGAGGNKNVKLRNVALARASRVLKHFTREDVNGLAFSKLLPIVLRGRESDTRCTTKTARGFN